MVSPSAPFKPRALTGKAALEEAYYGLDGAGAHMAATEVRGRHARTIVADGHGPLIAAGFHRTLRGMAAPRSTTFHVGSALAVLRKRRIFRGSAAVKTQRPIISDDEHVVLKFRPRTSAHPPGGREEPDPAKSSPRPPTTRPQPHVACASDLSRYERPRDEGDDFRHRMLANVAALAFTVALTAIGIWLAVSIADLRKTQDCVLMGRRDCARISVTPQG
jgi:hypothetical protein